MTATRMDPDFTPIIAAMAGMPSLTEMPLEQLRDGWDYSIFGEKEDIAEVRDLTIPVHGGEIGARLYKTGNHAAGLLVYYHGGGWVMGDLESHDRPLRALANMTDIAVLAVDYRLAPEYPFPTAFEDALAALAWAGGKLTELAGGDVPILVGGDSAGGNLAAAIALASRDEGPHLAGQLLLYPSLDGRCESESYVSRADCRLLTAADMRWYWDQYAPDSIERQDWRASPSSAERLAGSPPAVVVVAGVDPLRDEGLDYAAALAKADTPITLLHYPALPHGFFNYFAIAPSSGRAMRDIAQAARRLVEEAPS
jgi:acetyl esterase